MTNILELLKDEKVEWKKLGEVCEIIAGGDAPRLNMSNTKDENYKIPIVSNGIGENSIYGWTNIEKISKPSITISARGTIGWTNLILEPFYPIVRLLVLTPKLKVNIKYIYYIIKNKENTYILPKTGIPQLTKPMIIDTEIPIPSLETQEKIVDILDKFTNYVTELQSELQSRTKQYEYYRDMLLSEEYLNKITKEMEEDRRVRIEKLNDICELKRGKRLVKSELQEEGEFPVYQNSIIPLGYYHESNFDSDKTFIISAGSAGEIIYSDREFWAADDVYVLMTKENISSKFLYYSLLSKQHVIKSKVRKASVPRLAKEDIEKLFISLPSLSLQNKIVKILDKFQIMLADTKGLLPEEIAQRQKQYEYYREKLLTFDKYCDSTHARTHVDIV